MVAISGQSHIDPKAELAILAKSTAQECVVRGEGGLWPPRDPASRHALCAHRQLSKLLGGGSVLSVLLIDGQGKTRGICVLCGDPQGVASRATENFCQAASVPLGSALGLIQRARGNRFDRLASRMLAFKNTHAAKISLWAAVAAFCGLLFPMRYHVTCNCELQPITRRFIAAPFDAQLERSLVEPGDIVAENQVLAKLDGRDIQWELSTKRADAQRVAKESAGHVAAHESGKAEISNLELERLQLVIEQLEEQAVNSEIRSPLDGLVLLGDHSKLEGVPLEKGKTLFEIAPLDRMVVEIEIPEDEVRFVKCGMQARVRLASFPLRPLTGKIERVHPRAELREHRNVFVAEIACENSNNQFRPGMRGSARIATVLRPLAWNWFHKAYAAALTWLGW